MADRVEERKNKEGIKPVIEMRGVRETDEGERRRGWRQIAGDEGKERGN